MLAKKVHLKMDFGKQYLMYLTDKNAINARQTFVKSVVKTKLMSQGSKTKKCQSATIAMKK
jgi:hypothetical protein